MQPVKPASHDLPSDPLKKALTVKEEKINFLETLQPFIQLLLAIGNAIFLPGYFVYKEVFKRFMPVQKVVSQAIQTKEQIPTLNEEKPLDDAVESTLTLSEKTISEIQHRLCLLEGRFKYSHFFVQNIHDFKKIMADVKSAIDQFKEGHGNDKETKKLLDQIQEQLSDICRRRGELLLSQFERTYTQLAKGGISLPKDMREEMLQIWKDLEGFLQTNLLHDKEAAATKKVFSKLKEVKKIVPRLNLTSNAVSEPLRLKNIGQSCYMDSVLQALACIESVRDEFCQPIARSEFIQDRELFEKKLVIQQEIAQFFKPQSINRGFETSKVSLALHFLEGPSLERLRKAIFDSLLHPEFSEPTVELQHDAASVMELFIDHFIPNYRLRTQPYASVKELPGLEFEDKVLVPEAMLKVPLRNEPDQGLDRLIHWVMHKRINRDPRKFDPKDGLIVDVKLGEKSKKASEKSVDEYIQWQRFKELPPVLSLHFLRFLYTAPKAGVEGFASKDERDVDLPEDGIVDLTKYYDAPEKGPKSARYKIKSFVTHIGDSIHSGHYVTYVEIKGKYFYCDDMDKMFYKEITKEEFFERKDAYLLILERIEDA